MSIFTTPLQFGYFFGLLYAILFWIRGYQEERLSDKLLGFVMFFLAMEIQDYTWGFAGINLLWEELNGFPRYFNLAFAPTIFFYLNAQVNRDFKFGKKEWLQYLPYLTFFSSSLIVFLCGSDAVATYNESYLGSFVLYLERILIYISYIYYFRQSLILYKSYRRWIEDEYSDPEVISFEWLRNFIYLLIAGEVFKLLWKIIDILMDDLPYEQDWWWNLFTVGVICYVGIKGYAQRQPQQLYFGTNGHTHDYGKEATIPSSKNLIITNENLGATLPDHTIESTLFKSEDTIPNLELWKIKIDKIFDEDKIYLQPDLTLSDLAKRMKTNTSLLSSAINNVYQKNFNEFVNGYRVKEFIALISLPQYKNLTLLAIAFDCGFNSKATFNRVVKKVTGMSPKELANQ